LFENFVYSVFCSEDISHLGHNVVIKPLENRQFFAPHVLRGQNPKFWMYIFKPVSQCCSLNQTN